MNKKPAKLPTPPDHGGRIFEISASLSLPVTRFTDYSVSLNPIGPPPGLFEFLARSAKSVINYPEPWNASMIAAVASHHKVPQPAVVPGSGSTPLIYLIPRVLSPQKAVIVAPAFAEYGQALEVSGLTPQYVAASPEEDFLVTEETVRLALALKPDLVFVANPANPTGRLVPDKAMDRLVKASQTRNGPFLVVDEAFIDFCLGARSLVPLASTSPKIMVLRSMTKIFAVPGLRLGYAVCGDPDLVADMRTLAGPWSISTVAQLAAPFLLKQRAFLAKTPKMLAKYRAILQEGLAGFRQYPSDANFILLDLDDPKDSFRTDLEARLARSGIIFRNASDMPGVPPGHVRLAVRGLFDNRQLVAAFRGSPVADRGPLGEPG